MRTTVAWLGVSLALGTACRHHSLIAPRVTPVVERGVAGVVYDSLGGRGLADARVQLVDAEHPEHLPTSLVTDSLGGFSAGDLQPGRYLATFFHPRLDLLGIQAGTVLLDLRGPAGVWMDLAIPSAPHLRSLLCGRRSLADSTGMLIGRAIDARTRAPLSGAVVRAEWLDLDVRLGNGIRFGRPHAETISRADGLFLLCGVPMTSDVSLQASLPAERSGAIGVRTPAGGIAVRDLFLADSQHVVVRGDVLGANGGPIPRAHVSVANTDTEAVADENGIFSLSVDRAGTQTLVARAIGYYQQERTVDVLPDSAQWIELELPTMVSVLDTVHVRGRRLTDDRDGFNTRREQGIGTFLTGADIEARVPRSATDLIERSPATPLARMPNGRLGVRVRGVPCLPTLVLDGQSLPLLEDLTEIDNMVDLTRIARMEIYTAGEIPRAYMRGSPCAAVVIWTKR